MLLIPAIDIKEGKCVRLRQGRMEDDTVFSDDPLAMANRWVNEDARRLHLVDLDGAFAGQPRNADLVRAITKAHSSIPVQIGGGIRDVQTAAAYVDAGVAYVIVGTKAVSDPDFVSTLCREIPGKVIVGLDAVDGRVATDGWAKQSSLTALDLARRFEGEGISAIVYTDIDRDGMMQGVNVEATAALAKELSIPVIASGGVSSWQDISALCAHVDEGIMGAIVGRALYEGAIDLSKVQNDVDNLLKVG